MADGFTCDGCRESFPGRPALKADLSSQHHTIPASGPLTVGHRAGRDMANPPRDPEVEVEWPHHSTVFDLCVTCFSDAHENGIRRVLED